MTTASTSHPSPTPAAMAATSPRRGRAGLVTGQMLVLVACGLIAGAADSWIRPVKLAATDPSGGAAPRGAEAATPGTDAAALPAADPQATPTTTTPGPTDKTDTTAAPAADQPLGLHINLAQARKLFEQGTPFLDARTDEEFKAGHIAGAFHLPSDAFDRQGGAEALKFLDQNAPVVIYCGGGDCHASEYVAIRLEQAGFKSYHIMTDGFATWQAAGYDTAAGAQ